MRISPSPAVFQRDKMPNASPDPALNSSPTRLHLYAAMNSLSISRSQINPRPSRVVDTPRPLPHAFWSADGERASPAGAFAHPVRNRVGIAPDGQ